MERCTPEEMILEVKQLDYFLAAIDFSLGPVAPSPDPSSQQHC